MAARNDETWMFVVEWFDPMPQLKRVYALKYFVHQHQVEMVDVKTKKIFLKRSSCPPELTKEDFALGRKILLFSRELEIIDYGDNNTREKLQHQSQQTLLILSQDAYLNWGKILTDLIARFTLADLKSVIFPQDMADSVCRALSENPRKAAALSQGVNLIVSLAGEDGVNAAVSLCKSLEVKYGGGIYYCQTGVQVAELQDLITFNPRLPCSSTLDSCTCCIIKPHAFKSKAPGRIMDAIIQQGYEISAVRLLIFDRTQAEEFLEVYQVRLEWVPSTNLVWI
jgi:nucleoside-diphosphate kinase